MSFEEGIFPSLNKEAVTCPVYKKGENVKIIDQFHFSPI